MKLCARFNLECAHAIEQPVGVPRIHGHSYIVTVCVQTSAEAPVPLPQIEGYAAFVKARLDHSNLNDILGPRAATMEAIIEYVKHQWLGPQLVAVRVERPTIGASAEWAQ